MASARWIWCFCYSKAHFVTIFPLLCIRKNVSQAWLPCAYCKTNAKDALLLQVTLLFLYKNMFFCWIWCCRSQTKRWPVVAVGTPVLRQNGVILLWFLLLFVDKKICSWFSCLETKKILLAVFSVPGFRQKRCHVVAPVLKLKCTVATVGAPGLRKKLWLFVAVGTPSFRKSRYSSYILFPFCRSNGNVLWNSTGKYSCPVFTPSD